PPGWKVPSKTDWDNVLSSNTLYRTNDGGSSWVAGTQSGWTNSATNYSTGLKIGDALVLPAVGYRYSSNGSLFARGYHGYYWSSTADGTDGYYLGFTSGDQDTNGSNRSYGFSVRCLSE
ncbi:MAG: fibrobacter succinogenes major paralogous domain-containing protein, partial [Prevotellaceae bacterium]|nr:fibrobacter succinogenes major paralogous domain-containing protein [Prevotellaceae bacterium]